MTPLDMTVNENEAQALMLHHLRIAAELFEVLPGSLKIHRSVLVEIREQEIDDLWIRAAIVWFDKLYELYKEDEG